MKNFFFYTQFLNFIRSLGKLFDCFKSSKLPPEVKENTVDRTILDVVHINKTLMSVQVKGYPAYRPSEEEKRLPLAYLEDEKEYVLIRRTKKSNFTEDKVLVCVTYISTGKRDTILVEPDSITPIKLDN